MPARSGSGNAGPINSLSTGYERRGIRFCCQRQRRCRCLHERSCVGTCNSENDRPLRVALNPSVRMPLKAWSELIPNKCCFGGAVFAWTSFPCLNSTAGSRPPMQRSSNTGYHDHCAVCEVVLIASSPEPRHVGASARHRRPCRWKFGCAWCENYGCRRRRIRRRPVSSNPASRYKERARSLFASTSRCNTRMPSLAASARAKSTIIRPQPRPRASGTR
jgi:hypothetical protein